MRDRKCDGACSEDGGLGFDDAEARRSSVSNFFWAIKTRGCEVS
jgi:hypothetical protein